MRRVEPDSLEAGAGPSRSKALYAHLVARTGALLDVATAAAAFAFYLLTLAPDVVGHDGGEFQIVPPLLGIAHPTGYPLYTLLGWAWSHVMALGSVAWRMNLLSAVFGAVAVALVGHTARRLTGQWAAGLLTAVLFAVAPAVWEWSVVAGVRSLDLMLLGAVVLLCVGWRQAVECSSDGGSGTGVRPRFWLALLALAVGVALAHHRNTALLLPGVALFLLWGRARRQVSWPHLLGIGVLVGLPLLSYLYLPWRSLNGAPFDQHQPQTWEDFWRLVLGLTEVSSSVGLPAEAVWPRMVLVGGELARQITPLGAALALVGVTALVVRDRRTLALLALPAMGLFGAQVFWKEVGTELEEAKFLRAMLMPLAILAGCGAGWLAGMLGERAGRRGTVVASVLLLVSLTPFTGRGLATWQEQEARDTRTLDEFRDLLREGWRPRRLGMVSLPLLEPNALLLADWEQATVFWYLQLVEGVNPDVEVRYPLADAEGALREAAGRPVYLAAVRPGMKDALAGYPVSGVGSVVRVGPGAVVSEAAPALGRDLDYGHQIRLLGADFWDERGQRHAKPQVRNGVLSVSLYWLAMGTPDADYSVSVRLVEEGGRVVAQSDLIHPVLRLSPTGGWRAGEVRGDYHELPARGLARRAHSLDVILYRREANGFRNLPVYGTGGIPLGEAAALAVLERVESGG